MDRCISALEPPRTTRSEIQYFHRPELDLLRLTAFLMVFVAHTPPFQHLGWVMGAGGNGVCLFFLLSAFLIAELLMRERDLTHSVHAGDFFLRRILRIWPLYFLTIGLGVAVGTLLPYLHVSPRSIPWLLFFANNFYVAHYGWELSALGPLWSLSIEGQFYLVIPWIIKFGDRHVLRKFALCLRNAALARSHACHTQPSGMGKQSGSVSVFRRWYPARPSLPYARLEYRHVEAPGPLGSRCSDSRGRSKSWAPAWSRAHLSLSPLSWIFHGAILAFFNLSFRIPRVLLYLGRISYGLYVYHTFFLLVLAYRVNSPSARQILLLDLICLGLTILTASISYECFEKPFLRLKQRFAFVRSGKLVEAQGNESF